MPYGSYDFVHTQHMMADVEGNDRQAGGACASSITTVQRTPHHLDWHMTMKQLAHMPTALQQYSAHHLDNLLLCSSLAHGAAPLYWLQLLLLLIFDSSCHLAPMLRHPGLSL